MPSEVRILLSPRSLNLEDKNKIAGVAQLAEHNPSKVRAAGSSPVSRSDAEADVAQW